MIHVSKELRTIRKNLRTIPVTEQGSRTDRWQGIQHGILADLIIKKMAEFEFTVAQDLWYVNPSGSILFGAVDVTPSSMELKALPKNLLSEFANFSLAIRHSNNSKYALTFVAGARINGGVIGGVATSEMVHKKRHTTNFDPAIEIEEAIQHFQRSSIDLAAKIVEMSERKLKVDEVRILLMKTAEKGLIPWRNIEHIWKEILCPSSAPSQEGTAWSIYTNFAEKAYMLGVPGQLDFYRGLYPLFVDELDLGK